MIDRQRAQRKLREALPRILLESFFIVLSILLALAVNEWRQRHANQTLARKALHNFRLEISQNKQAIESSLPYHRSVVENIGIFLADPKNLANMTIEQPTVLLKTFAPQGIAEPNLRRTSWETAGATNALLHLDYTLIHRLAGTYDLQRMGVERTWNGIIEGLFKRGSFGQVAAQKEAVVFLHFAFQELVAQEEGLLLIYEKTLEALPGESL